MSLKTFHQMSAMTEKFSPFQKLETVKLKTMKMSFHQAVNATARALTQTLVAKKVITRLSSSKMGHCTLHRIKVRKIRLAS